MKLDLDGKKVVVAGGSRGIGLAIARTFRAEGADCLICGRLGVDLEHAEAVADCLSVIADVSTKDGVAALKANADERFNGPPDIVVCNVGSGRSVPPGEETIEEWQRVFDINLFSTARVIEAFGPDLKPGSAIACISSIAGRLSLGAPVAYAAAKAALDKLVANMAAPLGRRDIRIFGVAPGNILFPGSVWEQKSAEAPDQVASMLERDVPLQRLGTADEVARMVVFLASPQAGFVTGSVHVIDGGQARGA